MKPTSRPKDEAAPANITKRIEELGDWRGATLAHVRRLIHDADPDIEEGWKRRGTPVWSHDGGVCTGESYKHVVKLTTDAAPSVSQYHNRMPVVPQAQQSLPLARRASNASHIRRFI